MLLAVAAILLTTAFVAPARLGPADSSLHAAYTQTTSIYVKVVRNGWATANVLGVQNGTASGVGVSILVGGTITRSTTTIYNGEFWSLSVPIANGSVVQAAIGTGISPPVTVPAYVPQRVAPRGIIYAQGSKLLLNGTPIQLFGVDEETSFTYAMLASGLLGASNPSQFWGNNQLFPSGPDTKIPNVSNVDQLWQYFFQYFLHYNAVAGSASNPKVNVIRITVVDDSWASEGVYNAWKSNPTAFWRIFDTMLYWANRAGLYVIPVVGHLANGPSITPDESFYDVTSLKFAHHVDLVRAMLARYNNDPRIAMWDLWNEPDVWNNAYWTSIGGILGFRNWASTYIADVKPWGSNHLMNMGIGGFTLFPGIPSFGWQYYFYMNDIPGLDVGSNHYYATAQDQYLIDWPTAWHAGLNKPNFEGEFGYNAASNLLGYGYWPWYAQQSRASGWAAIATMVFLNDGVGPYADYPYTGALPAYPSGNSTSPPTRPVASFQYSPSAPTVSQSVTFDGSLSSDTVAITSYSWTFGDGGTGSGQVVNHAYSGAGNYVVSLTVGDANGSRNSTSKTVSVTNPAPPPPPPPPPPTSPPTVTTSAATYVGSVSARLNGNLTGLGTAASVTVGFRYGTSPSLSGAANLTVAAETAAGPFGQNLAGLSPGTTYYVAAWALGDGFASGPIASFATTSAPPSVTTTAATAKGQTTATLNGNLGSLGSASSVSVGFLYGTNLTLVGASNVSAGSLITTGPFSAGLHGLISGTNYYYRAWASGSGFIAGDMLNFTAMNPGTFAPMAHTKKPKGNTATTATLGGNVSDLGSASVVNVGFLYGTSPTLAGATNVTFGMAYAPSDFNLTVVGLVPGVTYYYEAWAEGQGFAWGGIMNVTLPSSTAPGLLAPAVLGVDYSPDTQTLDVVFSQAMNQTSVAGALSLSPEATYQLDWRNESYLQVHLITIFASNQVISLTIGPSATGLNGHSMGGAFTFRFAIPPAAPATSADDVWAIWLPWMALALAASSVVALALLVRTRRKFRALRASTKQLARRMRELGTLSARPTSPSPRTTLRPVPRPVRRPVPRVRATR